MNISVTIHDLTAVSAANLIAQLGGLSAQAVTAAVAPGAPIAAPPMAAPPMAASPPPAAPPPPPAPAAPAQSPMVASVTAAMQAYSAARGPTGVQDAKKVLAQVNCQRVSDATPEALDWLAKAFANPAYVPG